MRYYFRIVDRLAACLTGVRLRNCAQLRGHIGKIYALDISSSNHEVVSVSQDGSAKVWNYELAIVVRVLFLQDIF